MTSSSSSSPEISSANADIQDRFSYKHATHDEVLEDLSSRFILNLPDEELASLERICFQVEQAHWFYEDFIREENPKFPSLPLKKFSAMLFHACPLLHQWSHDHEQAFNTFMQYKTRVPVCGAIMLNDTWEKCILVKGWKSSSGWGFPKGKINQDEPEPTCAIREVLEETGYNLAGQIDPQDVIEMSIKEQKISLYIVAGVPEDYPFKTKTRKEISKIEWFRLTDLPTWKRNKAAPGKFYLISPFIGALKAFINERKPRGLPYRVPKAKNGPNSQIRPETTPLTRPSYPTDSAQESSSQSSSADNGDPHTPSPQYTESVVSHANAAVAEAGLSNAIATEILDTHFARLLSSLSMSARVNGNADNKPALAINTHDQHSASATPVPTTASSASSHPSSEPVDQPDWSTSVPRRLSDRLTDQSSTPLSAKSRLPSDGTPSLSPGSFTITKDSPQISHSFPASPLTDNSTFLSRRRQSGQHTSVSSSSSSGVSLTISPPRGTTSRRSSSTADISPYLKRPSEVPTSGKRLKQLALLETVADESARLTSFLSNREPSFGGHVNGSPMPLGARCNFAPGLPALAPPIHHHNPNDLGVIYSSGSACHARGAPSTFPSFHTSSARNEVFQTQQWTSHTYQPLPVNPHMNRDVLMKDTRVQNVPVYPPPSHIQSTYRNPFYPPIPRGLEKLGHSPTMPRGYGQHPIQPLYPQLASKAIAPPSFELPHLGAKRLADNAQLLSILNGNSTASSTGPGAILAAQMNNGMSHR